MFKAGMQAPKQTVMQVIATETCSALRSVSLSFAISAEFDACSSSISRSRRCAVSRSCCSILRRRSSSSRSWAQCARACLSCIRASSTSSSIPRGAPMLFRYSAVPRTSVHSNWRISPVLSRRSNDSLTREPCVPRIKPRSVESGSPRTCADGQKRDHRHRIRAALSQAAEGRKCQAQES